MESSWSVETILGLFGPQGSSDIKAKLVDAGVGEEAARQRISRSRGKVLRLRGLPLPRREQFLYLRHQYKRVEFWESLYGVHTSRASAYGVALNSIVARGFLVPVRHANIVTGSPMIRLKRHIDSQAVIERLKSASFLKEWNDENLGECLVLDADRSLGVPDPGAVRSRLVVEDILAKATTEWLKKTGLASYKAIKSRTLTNCPSWGNFCWDITAPSYVLPLSSHQNGSLKPGFVVADLTYSKLDEHQIKYFLRKCSVIRSMPKNRPFLAVLVARRFSTEALHLGRSKGVMLVTPETLFGAEIARNLGELLATLNRAAETAAANPERIQQLFASLSRIEGAAVNLRGALFELVVGHLVLKGEGSSIDIGVRVTNEAGEKAEIDVRRVLGEHEVALYECKGYQPSRRVTKSEIKKWLHSKIPIIRTALLRESRFQNRTMIFEYWTSGIFDEDAVKELTEASEATKKYQIRWKDGKAVAEYARKKKISSMSRVLDEHYMRHPLA